jgi:cell division protein FtsI (penicillin-binding protein 3)
MPPGPAMLSGPRRPPKPRRPRTARLGNPHRRLHAALLLLAFVLSLFVGRLLQLQGLDAATYAEVATRERLRNKVLPATRGQLTDRHGVALATTVDARNVTADPALVKDADATAAALAPILRASRAILAERLARPDTRFVYLAKSVTPRTWQRIAALELPGIFGEPVAGRVYPGGELAANVIGFVDAEGRGAGGLELALDRQLAGRDGQATYEIGSGGKHIPTARESETEPVPGADVQLTIDRDIQWLAQRAIAEKVKSAAAESGTVIVMDPRTGAILAMATAPAFNPAAVGRADPADRGNRAVSEVYEPGSTGKLLTAAAAIETGVMTPRTPVTVPPALRRGGTTFHDHSPHGVENLTFTGVVAKSSNMGTIMAAEKVGFPRLHDYMRRFGIAQPTGLGFPGESRGLLPDPKDWWSSTPYTLAFGQGYSITSLQGLSVYATIANDGVRVTPSLVKGYAADNGRLIPARAPAKTRVVSRQTAKTVRTMLEAVTGEGGTAPQAKIPGYRVAGKTGTANRVVGGAYQGYTASFIGFAPADKPQLVVSVVLQDPKRGHYGGVLCAPVFKEVMSFALQSYKVPPTGSKPPKLPLETGRQSG